MFEELIIVCKPIIQKQMTTSCIVMNIESIIHKRNIIIRNYGDRAFGVVFRSVENNSAVAASLSSSRRGTMVFKRTEHI